MYSVLIVEDERSTREALCNFFPWDSFGFQVIAQAENGLEALNMIHVYSPDVILCDIRMPIMSGLDLAKTLYEEGFPTRVIFLSGYRDFDFLQKAIQYGARNYILKPTKYDEISAAFQALRAELDAENNPDSAAESPTAEERIIQRVKKYVQGNLQYASLKTVSDLVHITPSYLSQYFKKVTGENFSDYLIACKMEKAAQMLLHSNYHISEIGDFVGYTSPKAFTKTFTRYFGLSPREYRNKRGDN